MLHSGRKHDVMLEENFTDRITCPKYCQVIINNHSVERSLHIAMSAAGPNQFQLYFKALETQGIGILNIDFNLLSYFIDLIFTS